MGNRKDEEPTSEPAYWTHDTSLFTGTFVALGKEPVLVRGKVHLSEEQYHLSRADHQVEPIETLNGTRTYIHMKPFVLVSDIRLIIGLSPQPKHFADREPAIGEVLESHEAPKKKERELGQAQAWYYPQEGTIVLWECYLFEFVRDHPLGNDPNMQDLWHGFERFLHTQCSGAAQFVTPHHDPIADSIEEYQQFLTSLGYMPHPTARAAWAKAIERG